MITGVSKSDSEQLRIVEATKSFREQVETYLKDAPLSFTESEKEFLALYFFWAAFPQILIGTTPRVASFMGQALLALNRFSDDPLTLSANAQVEFDKANPETIA